MLRGYKTSAEITGYSWPNDPNPVSFLGLLRLKTGLDFDLPSDAQWEFAARAGHGSGYWGDGSKVLNTDTDANLNKLARYRGDNPGGTSATTSTAPTAGGTAIVGSYKPNSWGLYDMHGNVWEWCLDWYEDDVSAHGGDVNISLSTPANTLSGAAGANRVIRGACWYHFAGRNRSAHRSSDPGTNRDRYDGFRVVCTAGLR